VQINKVGEQKLFKLFGHFSLILLVAGSSLHAQSFEDFKRMQNSSFSKYRDSRDAAFNNYLKAEWEEYSAKNSKPLYEKEKPKSITPTIEKKVKSLGPKVNIKIAKKVEERVVVKKLPQAKEVLDNKDIYIHFFGQKLGFNIDYAFKTARFYPQTQAGIANYFDIMASSNYEDTLREIRTYAKELALNDWGTYLLVKSLSEVLYSNLDEQKLFSWFFLNKLGYEVKIGIGSKHVVLMHYSKKIIYSTPSFTFGKKKFYVISNYAKGSVGRVYTYKQSYPDASKDLDLSLKRLPAFQPDLQKKSLSFKQLGQEFHTSYQYDKNLIDFMATYPQADYETYFNAPMSSRTYKSIAEDLKKKIDGKSSSVAINFVLNFVQKAFGYERDQQQFGREKVMFSDETLYYNKSDCEDRAILFSYLVKELFGISVIGVKYKDHMATALYIPMKGDSVRAGRRKFVIADPTYINANIGQSMPKYKSKIPESYIIVKSDKR